MKVLSRENDELLSVGVSVDKQGGRCAPRISVGDVLIEGPQLEIRLNRDVELSGLVAEVVLPGLTSLKILLDKSDVKGLTPLLNRGVVMFMLKALF